MISPKSLQQRLAFFVLFPVAVLLIGMGFAGFIYARNSLLAQWKEAAILKLQRAAHSVDMRLDRTKKWIGMLDEAAGSQDPDHVYSWVVGQLQKSEGVSRVDLTWIDKGVESSGASKDFRPMTQMRSRMGQLGGMPQSEERSQMMMMRRFHQAKAAVITSPRYDSLVKNKTVSLTSLLVDKSGQTIGQFEVVIRFDSLIADIIDSGWWQSNKAFLVDDNGNILAGTVSQERKALADNNDAVELKTLKALKEEVFGTIRGPGHPPAEVSGFYKLQEAPWSLVMIAPGEKILAPIVKFRSFYLIFSAVFIFLILLLIRFVSGRTASSIKEVSLAAERIAGGDFGKPLPVKTRDEVGELARSFNTMMLQLEERMRIKQALDVAMEVQQNLLPKTVPQIPGLDIAAKSIYCDQTGGDFYDFFTVQRQNTDRLGIAIGDVSGHGVSAALLMATIRAFIKSNVSPHESITESIARVNRLLAQDTGDTGQFVTLFYAEIFPAEKKLRWVRAGHDPALFYDPDLDTFKELWGDGIALGIDPEGSYQEKVRKLSSGQILVIGTDGIWEARNSGGEMFGRERLKDLIRKNAAHSSDGILGSIIDSIKTFQGSVKQEDDITLLVTKFVE
ncbi:MAG: SpoIIE family protein phosphatase [Desulfobacterales bacterium]|jgi:sigma-B regulation protein RsbU (phosphoserine phosphatase)